MNVFSRFVWTAALFICATLAQAEAPMGIQGNVTVVNDENNPVPVTGEITVDSTTPLSVQGEVSLPAPKPFVVTLGAIIQADGTNATSSSFFDVPAGSIAVVEHVSASCSTPPGNRIFSLRLLRRETLESGALTSRVLSHLPLNLQGKPDFSNYAYYTSSDPIKTYAGDFCENCTSSSIGFDVGRERADGVLLTQCKVTINGHLVTP